MKKLTNSELLNIFDANEWNAEEINGRVIAEAYNSDLTTFNLDVTGWTENQVYARFGFNDTESNEVSYFRNNSAYGSIYL